MKKYNKLLIPIYRASKCFKTYLEAQCEEMKKYKWIRSEEACMDVGEDAMLEWVKLYASDFRKKWLSNTSSTIKEIA